MNPARAASKMAIAAILTTGVLAAAAGAHAARKVDAVTLSCQGDTLIGNASVVATHPANVRLAVHAGATATSLQPSRLSQSIKLPKGADSYTFVFNVAGLGARFYSVRAMHGDKAVDSPVLDASACAPDPVVPEAPAALLLPLSALGTIGVVFGVIRFRQRESA